MRTLLILLALLPAVLSLEALTIRTAHTRYYPEREIRPILQYFGKSLAGQRFRTVVATRPDDPQGQYFIARLGETREGSPVTARMTLYTSASKDPRVHNWSLSGERLDNWLYLGITGEDWAGEAIQPLAWKIELLDSAGTVLADWKSFLWEMP